MALVSPSPQIGPEIRSAVAAVTRELKAQYWSAQALGDVRRSFGSVDLDAFIGDEPTAVYDITGRVVIMPDGARLEAHSGLRERADDPRFVSERMRGATPPALYKLVLLDKPFHGVTTLRLTPISGNVFGRTDLLAHTYMLRGRPESFGCVVFRDYPQFLKAFLIGRVKRLRVVPALEHASVKLESLSQGRRPSDGSRPITASSTRRSGVLAFGQFGSSARRLAAAHKQAVATRGKRM